MVETAIDVIIPDETFQRMDVYLLDQIFKSRIDKNSIVLDAGSGSGRNSIPLLNKDVQVTCIDPIVQDYGKHQSNFSNSSIELFESVTQFDFIICNAVLHFCESHEQFNQAIEKLISLLKNAGVLFIRMTSDIGIATQEKLNGDLYKLKDGSTRYLVSRSQITAICTKYNLDLVEPVKTTLVEDLRAMSTIVLQNNN